jgi:threonine dehydrogenase-like Zn-dependent dehydrogenase
MCVSRSVPRLPSSNRQMPSSGFRRPRRFLPDLIGLVWNGKINPGKVFDLILPLDQVAEGYRAMDERRAITALLRP